VAKQRTGCFVDEHLSAHQLLADDIQQRLADRTETDAKPLEAGCLRVLRSWDHRGGKFVEPTDSNNADESVRATTPPGFVATPYS